MCHKHKLQTWNINVSFQYVVQCCVALRFYSPTQLYPALPCLTPQALYCSFASPIVSLWHFLLLSLLAGSPLPHPNRRYSTIFYLFNFLNEKNLRQKNIGSINGWFNKVNGWVVVVNSVRPGETVTMTVLAVENGYEYKTRPSCLLLKPQYAYRTTYITSTRFWWLDIVNAWVVC